MAVTFKMKFIFVWICLFSEALSFPTQSPTDVNDTNVCCEENPKLIYKGQDSNRGINVYVFEFVSQSKEAKDKSMQGDRSAFKGTENREKQNTIIPTNKPGRMYGKKKDRDTETGTRGSTHMPDLKFYTNNSTISAAQNDIGMYEDASFLSNATEGLQTEMSHSIDVQKTNGYSNGADYYGTEGSAILDIPDYNDTDTGNQDAQVEFPTSVNDFSNNLGCSKSEGECKNLPKSTEHTFVTQPTTDKGLYPKRRKDKPDGYANRERNTMNPTIKRSKQTKKTKKHKSGKQTHSNVNTKDIPVRQNTGKIFQYSREQRRKTGGKRHNSRYYRRSSSESRSDSSQEFD